MPFTIYENFRDTLLCGVFFTFYKIITVHNIHQLFIPLTQLGHS